MSMGTLPPHHDVVVIGGGITGAGVAREAAAAGLNTLLVEQKDFAWGTSSRSSKMVHGGLRYLAGGHVGLTRQAVHERQRLLDQLPGLVDRMRYVMPHYRGSFPGPGLLQKLLWLYDHFSGEPSRQRVDTVEMLQWLPGLATHRLRSASAFTDAVTDDARLVLRLLEEARHLGARTVNYVHATGIEKPRDAPWTVTLEDQRNGSSPRKVTASVVVNATGAWADRFWRRSHGHEHLRPLRGSHIVLPFERLPVSVCLTLPHPQDRRPVFIYPWMGLTVVGTTDLDHGDGLESEPRISPGELRYLLQVTEKAFPGNDIRPHDILSTWAGIRPVVSRKRHRSPSSESREHVIWEEGGLISVAGGKLTTFRQVAREVLLIATPRLDGQRLAETPPDSPIFRPPPALTRPAGVRHQTWRRLQGYFGPSLRDVLAAGPLHTIPGSPYLWAELQWSAQHESVQHLDDLLLRRTRLGLILPEGGRALLPSIREHVEHGLAWSDARWQEETDRYLALVNDAYSLPPGYPTS